MGPAQLRDFWSRSVFELILVGEELPSGYISSVRLKESSGYISSIRLKERSL
jgi:hypothetical protein